MLCFLNGNHYDSVYPISRLKNAALCQCECFSFHHVCLFKDAISVLVLPSVCCFACFFLCCFFNDFFKKKKKALAPNISEPNVSCVLQPLCTSCCTRACLKWSTASWRSVNVLARTTSSVMTTCRCAAAATSPTTTLESHSGGATVLLFISFLKVFFFFLRQNQFFSIHLSESIFYHFNLIDLMSKQDFTLETIKYCSLY